MQGASGAYSYFEIGVSGTFQVGVGARGEVGVGMYDDRIKPYGQANMHGGLGVGAGMGVGFSVGQVDPRYPAPRTMRLSGGPIPVEVSLVRAEQQMLSPLLGLGVSFGPGIVAGETEDAPEATLRAQLPLPR